MKNDEIMRSGEFVELEEPKQNNRHGWFIGTADKLDYLWPDLELHSATADPNSVGETGIWPGYYPTEESANRFRDMYYAKYATPVIKKHNEEAWERAMKGI